MNSTVDNHSGQGGSSEPDLLAPQRIFTTALLLLAAMAAPLTVPGNPDQLLPVLPELVMIIFLCISLTLASKRVANAGRLESFKLANYAFIFICGLILTYLLPRMLWGLSHTPRQVWNPCSNVAPSAFVRLECYLHGAITQFPGPRQFYMTLAAFIAGTAGFVLSRLKCYPQFFGLYFLGGFSVLYCVISFIAFALGVDTLLPSFLGKSEFGGQRFALIITNPGWVWPFLSSGLVSLVWLAFQEKKLTIRVLLAAGAALVLAGILWTGQRGGLLLCLLVLSVFLIATLKKHFDKNRLSRRKWFIVFVIMSGLVIYAAPISLKWLLAKIGRSEFFDANRFSIWKTALPHVLNEKPIWGYGYGSWFQEFRTIAPQAGAPLFDTAHNLYVQLIFEHGLAGAFLILTVFVALVLAILSNLRRITNGVQLFSLALVSFGVITLVQEIDYVRPVFYLNAFFWGTLCGLQAKMEDKQQNHAEIFIPWTPIKIVLYCLCGISATASVLVFFYFPFGLYPYEGDLSVEKKYVERWMGPVSKVVSFGTNNSWQFNILPLSSGKVQISKQDMSCETSISANQREVLYLPNKRKFLPQSVNLKFNGLTANSSRFITARLYYPPDVNDFHQKPPSESNQNGRENMRCE
jgi:O-antigen ligase